MAMPKKYLFDVSFDHPQGPGGVPRKPAEPTFTRAQLEAERAAAHAAGHAAGTAEAAKAAEHCAHMALATLSRDIAALIVRQESSAAEARTETLELLRLAVRKIAPALCRKDPVAEIEAVLAECLAETPDEPRIVLRVAEPVFDAVQSRLAPLAVASGFAGKIVLLADAGLAEADCRVEWADGGAERNTNRLIGEIDAVLARTLSHPSPARSLVKENSDE